jgi:hypothetical protein
MNVKAKLHRDLPDGKLKAVTVLSLLLLTLGGPGRVRMHCSGEQTSR